MYSYTTGYMTNSYVWIVIAASIIIVTSLLIIQPSLKIDDNYLRALLEQHIQNEIALAQQHKREEAALLAQHIKQEQVIERQLHII